MSKLTLFFLASFFLLLSVVHFNAEGTEDETVESQQQAFNTVKKMTSEQMEAELLQMRGELQHQRKTMLELSKKMAQLEEEKMQRRSDDLGSLESVMSQTTQRLDLLTADVQAMKNAEQDLKDRVTAQDQARGTTYIRWGNSVCPNTAEMVYSGIVSGGIYTGAGAPANYLCLPDKPALDNHAAPSSHSVNYLYGSEYDICSNPVCETTPACVVCRVARASSIMIAGTNACGAGWHLEYTGHLMAGAREGRASSEYICVDSELSYVPGTQGNENQNVVHYVAISCGSLPCPPYVSGKLVTCVVCSK